MENTSSYSCEFGLCIWTSRRGWYYHILPNNSHQQCENNHETHETQNTIRKVQSPKNTADSCGFGPGWRQPPLSKDSIHQTCHDILGGFPNIPTSGLDGLTYLAGDQQTAVATLLPAFAKTCRQAWSRWPGRLTSLLIVPHILQHVSLMILLGNPWKKANGNMYALYTWTNLILTGLEGFGVRERERGKAGWPETKVAAQNL